MTVTNEDVLSEISTIPEFYNGKTVLITGGTGFLGKLIIEKLLYSCPDIKQIYVFIRNKKGVFPEKRLAALYKNLCFERLRKERDGLFQSKVKVVPGNMLDMNLGLSEEYRILLTQTTDVVIHSAASVRFDESLKESFQINVMATLQLLELAKQMCNLKCYVHVSTSYCNIKFDEAIEEKIYPPQADWRLIKDIICYNEDYNTINTLTQKLIGDYPNTYVFTKHLAEQAVNEQRGKLPIIIVRPSIVIGCIEEPTRGWTDNFNGPVGISVASAQGILRAVYGDKKSLQDNIPADVVTKGILAASWIRGTKTLHEQDDIEVYNACAGPQHSMSLEKLISVGYEASPILAYENTLRPMDVVITNSKLLYFTYVLVSHVLPALAVDTVFRVLGKKPMLLRLQRKVMSANIALHLFMTQSWWFKNDNFMKLLSKLNPQDRKQFSFSMDGVQSKEYIIDIGLRVRKDLMHQDEASLKRWRIIYKWEVVIDKIVKFVFYACVMWWILVRFLGFLNL